MHTGTYSPTPSFCSRTTGPQKCENFYMGVYRVFAENLFKNRNDTKWSSGGHQLLYKLLNTLDHFVHEDKITRKNTIIPTTRH